MSRTVSNLANQNGRTYVYLGDSDVGNKFLQMAENEGFTFGDGKKPTERNYDGIMAINHNHTINYVGTNGKIAFGCAAKTIGSENLIRIDFKKYIEGNENYIYE